jgi:hypothetical protein
MFLDIRESIINEDKKEISNYLKDTLNEIFLSINKSGILYL